MAKDFYIKASTSGGGGVTSVSASAPVYSSGGATPNISITQATSGANGYLTSTDWNTFNNKQSALVSGTNIKTVNSTSLLGSGNVSVEPTISAGTTSQYWRGDKTWQTLDKTVVGLSNVPNTDATNPANITQSASYRFVTDTEKATWNRQTIWKSTVNGTQIGTGTTSAGITYSQLITGGTFATGDIIRMRFRGTKSGTTANGSLSIYVNTTNSLSGATLVGILTANTRFLQMKRDLVIKNGSSASEVWVAGTTSQTDDATQANLPSSLSINWSNDQYIIFALTPTNAAESMTGSYYIIEQL